jgi:hypothetical protein
VQLDADEAEYLPIEQLTHAVAPVVDTNVPLAQLVQALEAPVADEYEPTAQEMQSVEAAAPGVVKYLPAEQPVQLVDPVSDA